MELTAWVGGRVWRLSPENAADWTTPVHFTDQGVEAFGLTTRVENPVNVGGGLVLSVEKGGPVNCANITFNPHSHGTHTESVGHIAAEAPAISEITIAPLLAATMVSIQPVRLSQTTEHYQGECDGNDLVISADLLSRALRDVTVAGFSEALVLRCLEQSDPQRKWSGSNPPYLTTEAIELLSGWGAEHLITDLPSIDREQDGGGVANHRIWWGLSATKRHAKDASHGRRTLTELAFIAEEHRDGPWILNLAAAALVSDAAPSRIVAMRPEPVD